MRYPRHKIRGKGCYYHLVNHVSGPRHALPFMEEDKEMGFQIAKKLQKLYCIDIISLCWMNNHFHMIVYCPGNKPPLNDVVERYNSFYKHDVYGHPPLNATAQPKRCNKVAEKLIDISEFMRSFQQRFTNWFNKKNSRQGPLWKSRFWSCILEGSIALWECVKYVELNPVRAGLVDDPGNYEYGTWGRFRKKRNQPFYKSFIKHLKKNLNRRRSKFRKEGIQLSVLELFELEIKTAMLIEGRLLGEEKKKLLESVNVQEKMNFNRFLIRVYNWTSGMIIGSSRFVENTAKLFYQSEYIKKKKKGYGKNSLGDFLVCFHRGQVFS
ncbi:MAG: transposase [bacterium]